MFGLFTGKIKAAAMAIFAALIPLLYLLGRRDQAAINRSEILEDALETEKKRSTFYKAMETHVHEIEAESAPDRDALIERLRDNGL